MDTIANAFFVLAFLVLGYSIFLNLLSLREGRFMSGLYIIPTILALIAGWIGSRNWQLILVVIAIDIGCLLLLSRLIQARIHDDSRR